MDGDEESLRLTPIDESRGYLGADNLVYCHRSNPSLFPRGKLDREDSYLVLLFMIFASVPLNTIKIGMPAMSNIKLRYQDIDTTTTIRPNKNIPPNNIQPEISTHQGIVPEDIFLMARPLR